VDSASVTVTVHSVSGTEMIDKYAIATELFPSYPEGFPFDADSFDLLSIPLPPGEDFGINEADETEDELQMEQGFGSVIGESFAAASFSSSD
jgi:hypothetical protein